MSGGLENRYLRSLRRLCKDRAGTLRPESLKFGHTSGCWVGSRLHPGLTFAVCGVLVCQITPPDRINGIGPRRLSGGGENISSGVSGEHRGRIYIMRDCEAPSWFGVGLYSLELFDKYLRVRRRFLTNAAFAHVGSRFIVARSFSF